MALRGLINDACNWCIFQILGRPKIYITYIPTHRNRPRPKSLFTCECAQPTKLVPLRRRESPWLNHLRVCAVRNSQTRRREINSFWVARGNRSAIGVDQPIDVHVHENPNQCVWAFHYYLYARTKKRKKGSANKWKPDESLAVIQRLQQQQHHQDPSVRYSNVEKENRICPEPPWKVCRCNTFLIFKSARCEQSHSDRRTLLPTLLLQQRWEEPNLET